MNSSVDWAVCRGHGREARLKHHHQHQLWWSIAMFMMRFQVTRFWALCQALWRPRFRETTSFSTVLNQVTRGLPGGHFHSRGQITKRFYDVIWHFSTIDNCMTKPFRIILWPIFWQNAMITSWMSYDRKTLFTQNTMRKMRHYVDADVIASNKSNGPTNHVLGPLKLYICQHQSTQCWRHFTLPAGLIHIIILASLIG